MSRCHVRTADGSGIALGLLRPEGGDALARQHCLLERSDGASDAQAHIRRMATIGIIMPVVRSAAKTVGRAVVVVMTVSIAAWIPRCQTTDVPQLV